MRLINNKKNDFSELNDIEKIVKVLDLKEDPYFFKENAINTLACLLPISTFASVTAMGFPIYGCALGVFSMLPTSLILSKYVKEADNKEMSLNQNFIDYVLRDEKEILTGKEIKLLKENKDIFDADLESIYKTAQKVKFLNVRRNLKDLSKEEYKESLMNL